LKPRATPRARRGSPLAPSDEERAAVLAELHAERFVDASPAAVYATLLDEGTYLASERTMYRVLAANAEVRERRAQLRHPAYAKPELLATGPNELWSWDITKLRGPAKWTWFHLYVFLDVFSRYVPGWMVATRESSALAEWLIADTVAREGIEPGTLTIHADRGSSMASRPVALLLADLGVAKSHSRAHTSNDNPYSEAHFKDPADHRVHRRFCHQNSPEAMCARRGRGVHILRPRAHARASGRVNSGFTEDPPIKMAQTCKIGPSSDDARGCRSRPARYGLSR
jgi:putative transposase